VDLKRFLDQSGITKKIRKSLIGFVRRKCFLAKVGEDGIVKIKIKAILFLLVWVLIAANPSIAMDQSSQMGKLKGIFKNGSWP